MTQDRSALSPNTLGIVGAIACTTIFALTIGLTYPLLSFVLERAGYSETAIGINAAMSPLGVVLASPVYPRIIERFGGWQVATTCMVLSGGLILLMGHYQSFAALLGLRLLLGIVDIGIFITSETWINQLAPPKSRGRIIGLYATALAAGFGAGPLLLSLTGAETFLPFLLGGGFCVLSALVVWAVRRAIPDTRTERAASSWSFLTLAPTLLLAILIYAYWESSLLALFPVYGLDKGLAAGFVTTAMSICIFGNVVLQIPIGWVADKTSRRGVMIACATLAAAGALALPHVAKSPVLLLPVLFCWGAMAGGIYTMAMTELGDRFTGSQLVAGNAAFALAFGMGGILGGPLTGASMGLFGPSGFSGALTVSFILLAGVALWRHLAPPLRAE